MKKIFFKLLKFYKKIRAWLVIDLYKTRGKKPWSKGYFEYKWKEIKGNIQNKDLLEKFYKGNLSSGYGLGVDERIVEYPWILANLSEESGKLLDAGSALNFEVLLYHQKLKNKEITITTLAPESNCFWRKGVSYVFGDIRDLPFRDNLFDAITCISTLEHVGMDNSEIYNTGDKYNENSSKDYLKAILELKRVLKPGGQLLITVPFGKYENHGFFQQFNKQMVHRLIEPFNNEGSVSYFKYFENGWQKSEVGKCDNSSYGYIGLHEKLNKIAGASAVACVSIIKNHDIQSNEMNLNKKEDIKNIEYEKDDLGYSEPQKIVVYESTYEMFDENLIKTRVKDYHDLILPLLPKDKSKKIIDLGCGFGLFLDFCRKQGYENYEGVDIVKNFTDYAKNKFGLKNINTGDIIDYLKKASSENYGAITAINVVEHIKKERVPELLNLIFKNLEKGGVFVAEMPNADSIHGIHTLFSDLTHEWAYTKALIIQLLSQAGFSEIRVYPNRVRKSMPIRLLQKILAKILSGDDKLLYSGNIIVKAKK